MDGWMMKQKETICITKFPPPQHRKQKDIVVIHEEGQTFQFEMITTLMQQNNYVKTIYIEEDENEGNNLKETGTAAQVK